MANIPGISGYTQPGVFARDIVRTSASSLGGVGRLMVLMGEGIKEGNSGIPITAGLQPSENGVSPSEILYGANNTISISDSTEKEGRYFILEGAPFVSGRTEVTLNGSALFGIQEPLNASSSFDPKYDFRFDPEKGYLELQSASIKDQDGKLFSSSGAGTLVTGDFGDFSLLQLQNKTIADGVIYQIKIGSMIDTDGDGVDDEVNGISVLKFSGTTTGETLVFEEKATNTISLGAITYREGSDGAASGNLDSGDGFVVADSNNSNFGLGSIVPGRVITLSDAGALSDGQLAQVGDFIDIDGYDPARIESIGTNSSSDTEIILEEEIFNTTIGSLSWEIRAQNLFIADHIDGDLSDPDDGYLSGGPFIGEHVGSILAITGGATKGLYKIIHIPQGQSRQVRVEKLSDSSKAFPDNFEGASSGPSTGLGQTSISYRILELVGDELLFGLKENSVSFQIGDTFTVQVKSKVFSSGDEISVKTISKADINRPILFNGTDMLNQINKQFGKFSPVAVGASLASANGASQMLIFQCSPSSVRKTQVTLTEEVNSIGQGGVTACGGNADFCEVDDLLFPIPIPGSGTLSGRPDADYPLNISIIRNGAEIPVSLSKFGFYSSSLETEGQQLSFVTSSDYSGQYTVVNSDVEILTSGDIAELFTNSTTSTTANFSTTGSTINGFDFDDSHATNSTTIVITSLELVGSSSNTLLTKKDDIAEALFGSGKSAAGVELVISSVISDEDVEVKSKKLDGSSNYLFKANLDIENIQFFIKDDLDASNKTAALLLNKSIISKGIMKRGDGLRISYVDQNDSDFSDSGWLNCLRTMEAHEGTIIVPLPLEHKSLIFRNVVAHCETMSTIANKKERLAFIGACKGVDHEALLGLKRVAVEDLGVIEGIQGDEASEILALQIEDLASYKLDEMFTSNRSCYFYPDEITIDGDYQQEGTYDGYYIAAAAAGFFCTNGRISSTPLTNKTLTGFSMSVDKIHSNSILNQLGNVGATVLQGEITPRVLASRTTSSSGYIEDEEPSIMLVRDEIKQILRGISEGQIGTTQSAASLINLKLRVENVMKGLVARSLITSFRGLKVSQDKVDPRQINIYVGYTPVYPVNYVYIEIEVGTE